MSETMKRNIDKFSKFFQYNRNVMAYILFMMGYNAYIENSENIKLKKIEAQKDNEKEANKIKYTLIQSEMGIISIEDEDELDDR